jgi:hypothetical protein
MSESTLEICRRDDCLEYSNLNTLSGRVTFYEFLKTKRNRLKCFRLLELIFVNSSYRVKEVNYTGEVACLCVPSPKLLDEIRRNLML